MDLPFIYDLILGCFFYQFVKHRSPWESNQKHCHNVGCKERQFYSLPFGKAVASSTSLNVISTSTKNNF